MKNAGFTEKYIVEEIVSGTTATDSKVKIVLQKQDGEAVEKCVQEKPDYRTCGVYYKIVAELIDASQQKRIYAPMLGFEALPDNAKDDVDYTEWQGEEK